MNYFEEMLSINVNDKVEQKNGLSYLSWSYAIAEVKKRYPDMTYEVWRDEQGRPYIYDENLGYMVFTKVTIEGNTSEMWLPVLDGANKTMKKEPYKYKVFNRKTQSYVEKICEAATMFEINKTIMRCLCKNLATSCGIGLYIYSGEDLPEAPKPICSECGGDIVAVGTVSAEQMAAATTQKYGRPICKACCDKALARKKLEEQTEIPYEVVNYAENAL